MKEQPIRCNNCYWEGSEDDLKVFTDLSDNFICHDIQYFKGCPNCETDNYLMNVNESAGLEFLDNEGNQTETNNSK